MVDALWLCGAGGAGGAGDGGGAVPAVGAFRASVILTAGLDSPHPHAGEVIDLMWFIYIRY